MKPKQTYHGPRKAATIHTGKAGYLSRSERHEVYANPRAKSAELLKICTDTISIAITGMLLRGISRRFVTAAIRSFIVTRIAIQMLSSYVGERSSLLSQTAQR